MRSNSNEYKDYWRSTPATKFGYSAKQLRRDFFRIYDQPADFLIRTAIQYRVRVKRLPFDLVIDRYLSYLEEAKSREIWLPGRFFAVATLLIEKHSELVLGFPEEREQALVDHLINVNRDRRQAAKWKYTDWVRLAHLVLRHHRPKTAMYFDPFNPDIYDITKEVDLPYAARKVDFTPPKRGVRRLPPVPLHSLIDEATAIAGMRTFSYDFAGRRP